MKGKCIYDQFQLDEDYNVRMQRRMWQDYIEGTVCVKTEDMKQVENYLKISGKAGFKSFVYDRWNWIRNRQF